MNCSYGKIQLNVKNKTGTDAAANVVQHRIISPGHTNEKNHLKISNYGWC